VRRGVVGAAVRFGLDDQCPTRAFDTAHDDDGSDEIERHVIDRAIEELPLATLSTSHGRCPTAFRYSSRHDEVVAQTGMRNVVVRPPVVATVTEVRATIARSGIPQNRDGAA
jgi:hypothetical protein